MGEAQAKQRDCKFSFLVRVCISSSWEQLLFCHSGVPVRGGTELQVQRLRACVFPSLCVLGKSHTQPSLGFSLESQPVEVARGALTLILGEFTLICPKWPNLATLSSSPLFSTLSPRLYK